MATSLVKTSSILQGFPKSRSLLAGNAYYNPGATFLIDSVTVGAGGASTITFSSIPNTYQHLELRCISRANSGGGTANVGFDGYLNSDTTANYSRHSITGDGSTAFASGYASRTYLLLGASAGSSTTSNTFGASVIQFLDYANTNKNKTVRILSGLELNNSNSEMYFHSSAWYSTNAITNIQLTSPGNFAQYSQFSLYGYMGS